MYDISQLNDMLVPELKDIADQLSIPHAQKTDKQELIYKILDRQAVQESGTKTAAAERPKRKRIARSASPKAEQEVATSAPAFQPEPDSAPEQRQRHSKAEPKQEPVNDESKKENFKTAPSKRGRKSSKPKE